VNPEVKKAWVEALRSDEFPQGSGRLEQDGCYCCLGVLEMLAYRGGVIPRFTGTRAYLSPDVVGWAGLEDTNPYVGKDCLGWLNDNGSSFADLANRIETYL
jgi:hypothetical protein